MKARLLVTLLALAVVAACSKKAAEPKASAKDDDTAGEAKGDPALPDPRTLDRRPPNMKPQLQPITLDEVKDFLPPLEGARVIKELSKAQSGEIVQVAYCYDKGEPVEISEVVKTHLTAAGWEAVNTRTATNPQAPKDRVGLTGHRRPYMIFGSVQRGAWAECTRDKGQTYVSLNVRKQDERAGVPAGGVIGPGGRPAMGRPTPVPVNPDGQNRPVPIKPPATTGQ